MEAILSRYQTVTPEIAEKYLEKNICNYRSINPKVVNAYAQDMLSGNWKANGESIKFNQSGCLVDGQHRLKAIVKSGISIPMVVITGIDDNISTFDIGRARTPVQIAKAQNLPNGVANGATIGAVSMLVTSSKNVAVPKQKIIDILAKESDTWSEAYYICMGGAEHPIARRSPIILAVYCLMKQNNQYSSLCDFFDVVNSGFQPSGIESSPAIVLRNFIMSEKSKREVRTDTGRLYMFSATLSAFRDFKEGVPRRKVYSLDPAHTALLKELSRIAMGE